MKRKIVPAANVKQTMLKNKETKFQKDIKGLVSTLVL